MVEGQAYIIRSSKSLYDHNAVLNYDDTSEVGRQVELTLLPQPPTETGTRLIGSEGMKGRSLESNSIPLGLRV